MATELPQYQSGMNYRIVSFMTTDGNSYTFSVGLCKLGHPEVFSTHSDRYMAQLLVGEVAYRVAAQLPAIGIVHTAELVNDYDLPVRLKVEALTGDQVRYIHPLLSYAAVQVSGVEVNEVLQHGVYRVIPPDDFNLLPGERGYTGYKHSAVKSELLH